MVQPSSGKGQPSQSANLPKIEKNQEDFKNKDQDKQKEKEQEQKQEKFLNPPLRWKLNLRIKLNSSGFVTCNNG